MVNSFSHGAEGFAVGNVELAHWRSPIGGLSWRRRPGSLPLFRMQPRAEAIGFIFNPMFGMSGKLAVRNLPATAFAGRIETWAAMVSLADDYRAKAAACAELAAKTVDPQSKRVIERSAEQWNSLADGITRP
jgi:hypothetical protein